MTTTVRRLVVATVLLGAMVYPQPAVAASGGVTGHVVANPLLVSLSLSASRVRVGDKFSATVTTKNLASTSLRNATIGVRADRTISIKPSKDQAFSTIGPTKSVSATWTLCATTAGNFLILGAGTATSAANTQFTAQSPAALVSVTASSRRCT